MVDALGHVAMGLLWAIPTWFVWSKRVSLVFIAFIVPASLFPDVDVWLHALVPGLVQHHGVVHTIAFVALAALVFGTLITATIARPLDRWLTSKRFDKPSLFVFATAGLLVGGLSHLFADMLSAPDIANPVNPFWPLFHKPWSVDVIWYDSPWWNQGLLVVAIALHLVVAYVTSPYRHSYRLTHD